MSIEQRIVELGFVLPNASEPQGSYANCVRTGNLLYVSGKGPAAGFSEVPQGKLGREYDVEQGYAFARAAGLDILAAVKLAVGRLDRVSRVVKLQGFINATDTFEQHPKVLDGCSDLMVAVFGEKGLHARSVFGATSVRENLPIIIDSIFEIAD
ncbi:RidA family protein [Photobacterium galatheae]|uniref:RidA family protein n=1 Tax=Photobacterium galatheae TaxID=1654360 RepID=UPI00202CD910|nr:RidA family protein [Photobacterium galatheae]MCM0147291.1 RidA family protein [Photobacterium galatheae]